ncbi:MAG: SDR family NAD(P)-dependent oxidoreductase [Microbacterium sp.]
MPRTALITGASSGLGAEFARQLAARGAGLVLVSPEEAALVELAAALADRFRVDVEVLTADLLVEGQLEQVVKRVTDPDRPIEMLVNSAGFGLPMRFDQNDIDDEVRHLRLLVEVPMRLTHAALGPMLERGSGRIVNIASVAGFIPFSTYGASKAWLISFSGWANGRYSTRGVTVTAVCPGFTHTRFHERMALPEREIGLPDWLWLDARDVVSEALRDIARGKALSVPTLRYKAAAALSRVVPSRLIARSGAREG